jgi:Raf kinase inhibitor-like YbhB/YbcL family protein
MDKGGNVMGLDRFFSFFTPSLAVYTLMAMVPQENAASAFELKSQAFKARESIPAKYTCMGKDVSPGLSWTGAPPNTRSYAIICDDPDAPMGTWVHWVYYDIPPSASSLPEGMSVDAKPPPGGTSGVNDFGKLGYGGPCPPSGTHRYFFKLYALDKVLGLVPRASKADLEKAMQGHILAKTELMGTFKK